MYYSDRENGPKARVTEQIDQNVWGGIYTAIQNRIDDGSFGIGFPDTCPDGMGIIGCDSYRLSLTIKAEIPEIDLPLRAEILPSQHAIFDVIELLYQKVGKPVVRGTFHAYFSHYHYDFDEREGKRIFREDVNRLFSRNGIAFELNQNGQIIRLLPETLQQELIRVVFTTEDNELNELLETARARFLNPRLDIRKDALEKLWDGWERLKTIENPNNKADSVAILLNKVSSEETLKSVLDAEARQLTLIGNNFRIRHSEIGKVPINESEIVDYLFYRLFIFIILLLRKSERYSHT